MPMVEHQGKRGRRAAQRYLVALGEDAVFVPRLRRHVGRGDAPAGPRIDHDVGDLAPLDDLRVGVQAAGARVSVVGLGATVVHE